MYVCMYISIYMHIYMCVYVYIYIYICRKKRDIQKELEIFLPKLSSFEHVTPFLYCQYLCI